MFELIGHLPYLIFSSLSLPPLFQVYPGLYCLMSMVEVFLGFVFFSLCLFLAELTGILDVEGSFISVSLKQER